MEKILIVDDVLIDRKILVEMLSDSYEILEASNGEQAIEFALRYADEISLVLLDIVMPILDGYEVLRLLKCNFVTSRIPVILISMLDSELDESKGLTQGAIDFITKPFNPQIVKCRVRNHVELKKYQNQLQDLVDKKTQKILKMSEAIFDAVTSIIEYRSLESGRHVKRIRLYSQAQLDYLLSRHEFKHLINRKSAKIIARASSLHDVGKVSIPDRILLKPGKLTEDEYEVMKTHASIGGDFIDLFANTEEEDFILYARQICRHHHERWDGTGYPDGLKGEEIPIASRVVAISDVYDALVSKRIYKDSIEHDVAIQIISKGAGTQFDPTLISYFLEIADSFKCIAFANRDDLASNE